MKIRQAFPRDLPAVEDVILEAMSVDPEWLPFFPRGARGDAGYIDFVETILKPGLDPKSQDFLITVVEVDDERPQRRGLVVAVAVWHISLSLVDKCLAAADGAEGSAGGTAAKALGGHFMHLRIMATRPHYQQQGYAKALCHWGMDAANKRGVGIAVLTGPRGSMLFSDLGFVDVGPLPVRVGSGKEEITVKAMVLAPARKRRGSFFGPLFRHVYQ